MTVQVDETPLLHYVGDVRGHAHYALASGEELLVWTPESDKEYRPLLVYLHGASPRGTDIAQILAKGPGCVPQLLADGELKFDATVDKDAAEKLAAKVKEKRGALREAKRGEDAAAIAAAQEAHDAAEQAVEDEKMHRMLARGSGCVVVSPLLGAKSEWCKTAAQFARTMKILETFLAASRKNEGGLKTIDEYRVFCTGASCGGLGTFTLACRLAQKHAGDSEDRKKFPPFASVAPICGGGNIVYAALLRGTPSWFWHSASDSAVPCSETEALVAALDKLHAPVRFKKLTDEETPPSPDHVAYMTHHNAWTPAYKQGSDLWPWLFAQSLFMRPNVLRPANAPIKRS